MFFGLDRGSAELRSSNVKGKNPFKDKRVRQAMAHAIDFEPILHDLMGELHPRPASIVAPRWLWADGKATDLLQPQKAEACWSKPYTARFQRDPRLCELLRGNGEGDCTTCEGVAEQLGKIGIEVAINFLVDGRI